MITINDYNNYVKASRESDDKFVCFLCGKASDSISEEVYGICRIMNSAKNYDDDIQMIQFHKKCFKAISGEAYIFDF